MKIAVVGLGKIGLTLASQYASKGHAVVGVDINEDTVSTINSGQAPFPGEAGLAEALQELVPSGFLRATSLYEEAVPMSDYIVVAVPLFATEGGHPDFVAIDSATNSIAKSLTSNSLVIYETTLPIGTTRHRLKPMLEHGSGLVEGIDFHLVFSPERVYSGRIFEDLARYPKLIGGINEEAANKARNFYNSVIDFEERDDLSRPNGVWDLGSTEAAEMAKLAETTYRDVNIALANQFALHASEMNVDVHTVIEACNSQPFSHIHQPGISVGGHCIPVYPQLYMASDKREGVVSAARKFNSSMPRAMADQLVSNIGEISGLEVLVLGLAYREGVKEDAFSGTYELAKILTRLDAKVFVTDPLYTKGEIEDRGFVSYSGDSRGISVVILHTPHEVFRLLSEADFPDLVSVLDGRNFLDPANWKSTRIVTIGK